MTTKKRVTTTRRWSIQNIVTTIGLSLTAVGGAFGFGIHMGKTIFDKEKIECFKANETLLSHVIHREYTIDSLRGEIDRRDEKPLTTYDVFVNGRLGKGLDLNVDTDKKQRKWVDPVNEDKELCMTYPKGQLWGAVFITVGKPSATYPRASMDFSKYTKLVVELKGDKETKVQIGLKDNLDQDDGSETKVTLTLKETWETYEIDLKKFTSADLQHLYVLAEFVFEDGPQHLCVRKIQFK